MPQPKAKAPLTPQQIKARLDDPYQPYPYLNSGPAELAVRGFASRVLAEVLVYLSSEFEDSIRQESTMAGDPVLAKLSGIGDTILPQGTLRRTFDATFYRADGEDMPDSMENFYRGIAVGYSLAMHQTQQLFFSRYLGQE